MTSAFADMFGSADPLLDAHFGETFTVTPRAASSTDVNARKVVDVVRQAVTFIGIWSDPHSRTYPQSRSGHAQNLAGETGDDRPTVDYVTKDLAYRCRIGDIVARQSDGVRYTVSDIDEDDVTRTCLALTTATRPGT